MDTPNKYGSAGGINELMNVNVMGTPERFNNEHESFTCLSQDSAVKQLTTKTPRYRPRKGGIAAALRRSSSTDRTTGNRGLLKHNTQSEQQYISKSQLQITSSLRNSNTLSLPIQTSKATTLQLPQMPNITVNPFMSSFLPTALLQSHDQRGQLQSPAAAALDASQLGMTVKEAAITSEANSCNPDARAAGVNADLHNAKQTAKPLDQLPTDNSIKGTNRAADTYTTPRSALKTTTRSSTMPTTTVITTSTANYFHSHADNMQFATTCTTMTTTVVSEVSASENAEGK